jgi:S1-C subfamily serine protease
MLSVPGRVVALAIAGLVLGPALARADAPDTAGRPYLGVAAEPNDQGKGVIVRDVRPESPAGKAGLKDGDRVIMAGDQQVKSFDDLRNTVANHKPGEKLTLKVERDGKEQTIDVTLGNEPRREGRGFEPSDKPGPFLGVFTQPLNADIRDNLKLKVDRGALVARVLPGSPAAKAGIQELDVITAANDTPIASPQDLRQAVEKAGIGKELTLKVQRGDKAMDVKAQLAEEGTTPLGSDRLMPPEGFGRFQGRMPMFPGQERMSTLEKKLQDLENRVDQLEKQKPANK